MYSKRQLDSSVKILDNKNRYFHLLPDVFNILQKNNTKLTYTNIIYSLYCTQFLTLKKQMIPLECI